MKNAVHWRKGVKTLSSKAGRLVQTTGLMVFYRSAWVTPDGDRSEPELVSIRVLNSRARITDHLDIEVPVESFADLIEVLAQHMAPTQLGALIAKLACLLPANPSLAGVILDDMKERGLIPH